MIKTGIYKIKNILNNHIYIGSAVNIQNRWKQHQRELKQNKHHSKYLQNAYNQYGESNFEYSILIYCEKKDLLFFEQRFLNNYKPEYNMCKIAGSQLGMKRTNECKIKMANSAIGNKSHFGHKHSEETKRNASERMNGKPSPMLGKTMSEESKKKMSEAAKGKIVSENTKQKMSNYHKGKPLSEETKRRMSEAAKGKIMSDEARLKMSISGKERYKREKEQKEQEELQLKEVS